MHRFGLQFQVIGWLLLIGVLPTAAVSAYAYSLARAGLFREAAATMRADGDAAVARLDESLALARAQVALAARQVAQRVLEAKATRLPPRVRSKTSPETPPREDFEPARSVLASWGQGAPVPVQTWAVVDILAEPRLAFVDGKAVPLGTLSDRDRELASLAQAAPAGEVVFGGVVTSAHTSRRVLTFATPIIGRDGTALGSLHGEIPSEWFGRVLQVRATPGGSLWVFDHTGHVVLTTDAGADAGAAAANLLTNGRGDDGRPVRAEIGSESVAVMASPLSVSGSSSPWTVAVSVPERRIAVRADPWRYVAVAAVPSVAVVLISLLVGTAIARPIKRLEEGTRRIAQGDLDFDLRVRGSNELDRLAGSFVEMAYALKRAQERLTKTERMAAIGGESLAIEHEVHRALKTVIGAADRVLARPDLPEPVREQLMPIHEAATRMRDLLQKLEQVHDHTQEPGRGTPAPGREAGGAA